MSDQSFPNRHSIRLKGYDYSQGGAYFVTICALKRLCLFGRVADADRTRECIASNPANWAQDRENPDVVRRPKER